MANPPIRWRGKYPHRYADNPLEAKLARAWAQFNKTTSGAACHLDYLMDDSNRGQPPATDEQRETASTVIQWLGSPVGFAWLVETLGKEIHTEVERRRR